MRLRVLIALFAALALVSCGESGDSGDVENLLDKAFRSDIHSANLKVDATLQLKGTGSLDQPVRIQASGPFRTNKGKFPSADLELRIGSSGGQTIQTGFLSTGDRAFVKFEDVYYEQPASQVRQANRAINTGGKGGSLRSLGLNPRTWLAEASEEGDERVGGVETTHVSGTLDVERVMKNINEFVQRSSAAIGGAKPPGKLSAKDIQQIADVVKDPEFDVYVGKEDDTIRKVAGRVEFEVPEDSRKSLGGIEGGSLEFTVELSDVNGDQEIEAPTNARPISKLTTSLGGTGVLGGATGTSGGGFRRIHGQPGEPQWPGYQHRAVGKRGARRRGLQALRRLPRQGRSGGHGRPPALRAAAERVAAGSAVAAGAHRRPAQVALGVDAEASRHLGELRAHRPAVGSLVALVIGRGPLQQHAAGVVAHLADGRALLGAQRTLTGHRGQLRALHLDRLRVGSRLLDQGGSHHLHRLVGQIPGTRELKHREPMAFGDRANALEPVASGLHPAVRAEAAVIAGRKLVPGEHVVVKEPAVVHDAGDYAHPVTSGGVEGELSRPGLERVEDQHGPVDQLAVALEAAGWRQG